MRLGILTQYYPPEMGAPQARLSELAARFIARSHEVVVLTAMPNYPRGAVYPGYGGWHRRESLGGAEVLRCYIYPSKSTRLVPRLTNYFSFVASSLIVGAATLPKLDFLLTESPPLFLGLSGFLLSRLKGARWIFNVSDLWPESAVRLGAVGQGLGLRLAYALEAFCYRAGWLVSGQSREILADITSRFPGTRTFHLSNGVDTRLFTPGRAASEARRRLGEPGGCVAVYAGLHGIAQGLEQVVAAAGRLGDVAGLRIVLVGDGPEKERLIRQAGGSSNIAFLDPFPREEMPSLLASADIALIPLKNRLPGAVPSKLYEAMGAGVPVVLAAEGEAAEIVRETRAGIAVPPGDGAALAEAVRTLAGDPALRREMGQAGRRAAEARFDRAAIADRFIGFLEDALKVGGQA